MASNAIGDIDFLIQGAGGDDEDDGEKFEERLLNLVLAALAGKDKKKAAELEVASIEEAINTLEREKDNIHDMLGEGEDRGYVGPQAPTLPPVARSTTIKDFTLYAMRGLGHQVVPNPPDLYAISEKNGAHYYIRFEQSSGANIKSIFYDEGSSAFQRLVDQVIATGLHHVDDLDNDTETRNTQLVHRWIESFGGVPKGIDIEKVDRKFNGKALVRVRSTVLHDSYERLVEVACSPTEHFSSDGRSALRTLVPTISDPIEIGLNTEKIAEAAGLDEGIAEFSRFYLERREQEVRFAGSDERKSRKLYDEFTPRFDATVVALEGNVHREIFVRARFDIDNGSDYESSVSTVPSSGELIKLPILDLCGRTGRKVPKSCLSQCQISGTYVLKHLLVKSELSGREVLPEHIEFCSLSRKRAIRDELEISDVSGQKVIVALLRKSEISGKRAEPQYFSRCSFTNAEVLKSELSASEISGRIYRLDQEAVSNYSSKKGHSSEFITCFETRQLIAAAEAEQCQETGKLVRPGVLVNCEATAKRVLPSECDRCTVTNKIVLKRCLVSSSVSQKSVLSSIAIRSSKGNFCFPSECQTCAWSGEHFHPDDLRICALTGLTVHVEYLTEDHSNLRPLFDLLNDLALLPDGKEYPILEAAVSRKLNGLRCRIVSAAISPTRNGLAVCAVSKLMLGLKTIYLGFVFSPLSREIVGRVAQGKRSKHGWERTN